MSNTKAQPIASRLGFSLHLLRIQACELDSNLLAIV